MQNILITGAFGFIGSNLSNYLAKRKCYALLALDIINERNSDYLSQYSWDNLNNVDWSKVDVIIHLAGKAHDLNDASDLQSYIDVNVGLTRIIFDKFLKSEIRTFIFFSSVKAIADTVNEEFLLETAPPNPQTAYGKSKLMAEQYILNKGLPKGKKLYILRPSMIHGPGNKGNLNLLFRVVKSGIPWPLGAFHNKRSFTSIDNLQFIIDQLIGMDIDSGIYHISDDEALSTNTIIGLIAYSMGRKAHIWYIWPNTIRAFARIGDTFGFPLNSERLKKLTQSYVVSNLKIKAALGIHKMPFTASEGMQKTLFSFTQSKLRF